MTNTDVDVMLAAGFERWGVDLLPRLRGRFAVLLWNESRTEGVLAVDHLGAGSLFYTRSPTGLAFAVEVGDLFDALKSTPGPNELAVCQWLVDGALGHGRTLYEGVSRLEGGHLIRIRNGDWRIERYWSPRYVAPFSTSRGELAHALREQVVAAVDREIPDGAFAGTQLSGGLDSSVIAAAAAGTSRSAAYSMIFPGHPSVDESPYIDAVVERLRIPSRRVEMHEGSLLRPSLDFLQTWKWPCMSPGLMHNLAVGRLAAADDVDVLFDGEGGDELFGASPYLLADTLSRGRLFSARRLARQLVQMGPEPPARAVRWLLKEYGLKGAAPRSLHTLARRVRGVRAYALPWLTDRSRRLLEPVESSWDWKSARGGPRWWAQRVDELTVWRERLGSHDYLRRKAAMTGVRDAHPFLDDVDLAEFVLRLPPHYAFDANFSRPLLRTAMEGVLPDEVRLRPHKATFNEFIEACLDGVDRPALEQLLRRGAKIDALVDTETLNRMYVRPPREQRPLDWAGVVWRAATAECWLRSLDDASFPQLALDSWTVGDERDSIAVC